MRHGYKFIIVFVALIVTANTSHSQYKPKRPAVPVEQSEVSFELVQASGGMMKVRMTNKGDMPLRFYDSFTSRSGLAPEFRLCYRSLAKCGKEEWINPNFRVSSLVNLPADMSVLEPRSSIDKAADVEQMLAVGEIYNPDPGVQLQIKFHVMLDPYFEEYVEYVSAWMPLETLMGQSRP